MSVKEPVDFFAHVKAVSTLAADKTFATYATYLVSGFCSQSGAERTNKYMVEVQGRKKATNLDLEKGRTMLELKMHLMHKAAVRKVHEKEQRDGVQSVAQDLRSVYLAKRMRAKEVSELRRRLAELRDEEKDEEDAEAEVRAMVEGEEAAAAEAAPQLVTEADVDDVLGVDDDDEALPIEPYELPDGYVAIVQPPPEGQLVRFALGVAAPAVVSKKIMFNYNRYGWILGTVLRRNGELSTRIHAYLLLQPAPHAPPSSHACCKPAPHELASPFSQLTSAAR